MTEKINVNIKKFQTIVFYKYEMTFEKSMISKIIRTMEN